MTTSTFKNHLMRVLRAPFMPVLLHLDCRAHELSLKLSALEQRMAQQDAQIAEQGQRFHCDAQAVVQSGAFVERAADDLTGSIRLIEDTQESLQEMIKEQQTDRRQSWANRLFAHDGPIGKAGLWFNPPVVLNMTAQGVELDQIHERIIEVPFIYRVLAGMPAAGRVLDVGCAESSVAFSIASLGFDVLGLDPRGYPLQHENLCVIKEDIAKWKGPEPETLDAIVCLSSLEHFGLNAYDSSTHDSNLDYWAMRQFRKWLKKGGRLALTAPYGRSAVSDFERVYGAAELDRLLEGWHVKERLVYARDGNTEWRQVEEAGEPWPEGVRGVVMINAERI